MWAATVAQRSHERVGLAEMQIAPFTAANPGSAADIVEPAEVLDRPYAPPRARPGIRKDQLAAETLRLYAGDWLHF